MKNQEAIEIIKFVPLYRYECELEKGRQSELFQALSLSIKALEKQIPKEVIEVDYALGETEYRCPSCNLLVSRKYCEECGQKIDWKLDI